MARRLAQLSAEMEATRSSTAAAAGARSQAAAEVAPAVGADWWDSYTHVSPSRPRLVVVDEPVPTVTPLAPSVTPPPLVPVPGRHAARRPRGTPGLLPEPLRGRMALGPAQLAVVAVLVAVGLAVTAWWVVRGDAEPASAPLVASGEVEELVPLPPADGDPGAVGAAPGAPGETGAAGGSVTVDVSGKVRTPGIVVLDAGSRVVDALKAAGGARPGVDLSSTNLARPLIDGEQILVGVPAAAAGDPALPPVTGGSTGPSAGGAPTTMVNINLAAQAELETVPEVGPVTATAIIAWRDEHGGFTTVDELLEVDGIGEVTLEQMSPYVTI